MPDSERGATPGHFTAGTWLAPASLLLLCELEVVLSLCCCPLWLAWVSTRAVRDARRGFLSQPANERGGPTTALFLSQQTQTIVFHSGLYFGSLDHEMNIGFKSGDDPGLPALLLSSPVNSPV